MRNKVNIILEKKISLMIKFWKYLKNLKLISPVDTIRNQDYKLNHKLGAKSTIIRLTCQKQ